MFGPAKSCTGKAGSPSVIHTSAPCGWGAPLMGFSLSRVMWWWRSGTQRLLTQSMLILESMRASLKKCPFLMDTCFLTRFFSPLYSPSCFSSLSTLLSPPFLCLCLSLYLWHQLQVPRCKAGYVIDATFCYLGASDLDTRTKRPTGFIQVSALGQLVRWRWKLQYSCCVKSLLEIVPMKKCLAADTKPN